MTYASDQHEGGSGSHEPAAPPLPPFPRPASTYTGREQALRRALSMLEQETLFLIYGVCGIGKSEFVYKLVDMARAVPSWKDAPALLLTLRAEHRAEHLVALLRLHTLGPRPAGPAGPAGFNPLTLNPLDLEGQLAEVVAALNARPYLIFIDDLQRLESETAARLLLFLSRYVVRSRFFIASSQEIPLLPGTPLPVLIRLEPLADAEAAQLATTLGYRLGITVPDGAQLARRAHGSPQHIQLLLCDASALGGAPHPLGAGLRALSPLARRVLLGLAAVGGRCQISELAQLTSAPSELGQVVQELTRRFFVQVEQGAARVHDTVKAALLEQASEAELLESRRTAARLHTQRFRERPLVNALDCVAAVHSLLLAEDAAAAWQLLSEGYPSLAAVGLDPLLTEPLRTLSAHRQIDRLEVGTLHARILLRQGKIQEAKRLVEQLRSEPQAARSFRYLCLAAAISQRSGLAAQAEALVRTARAVTDSPRARFHADLLLADLASLSGEGPRARLVLSEGRREGYAPTAQELGRWGWSRSLSYLYEEQFTTAATAAAEARAALAGTAESTTTLLLAQIELQSRVEGDDVRGARRVLDEVLEPAATGGGLSEHLLSLTRGLVLSGEGDLEAARRTLEAAYAYLRTHGDIPYAAIAAVHLGRTLLGQGEQRPALEVTGYAAALSFAAGLRSLHLHSLVLHAQALLSLGEVPTARKYLQSALELGPVAPRGAALARLAWARLQALQGELIAAHETCAAVRAEAAACSEESLRHLLVCEVAELELLSSAARGAVQPLEDALSFYASCGCRHGEARAALLLAGTLLSESARSGSPERIEAALSRGRALCTAHGYKRLLLRCVLIEAALLARRGDLKAAQRTLRETVDKLGPLAACPEGRLLQAALTSCDSDSLPAHQIVELTALGLRAGGQREIIDRSGRRLVSAAELLRIEGRYALWIDVTRHQITAPGQPALRVRPQSCALLARLVEGGRSGVSAAQLFKDVWGGREYHPLRHRNVVYVALNRLRTQLRELLPDQSVIETLESGWRLAEGVEVGVLCGEPSPSAG